jgi:hypothetical protein
MKITQRFCKNETMFIQAVNAIVVDGFDVFSICQSIDGVWHAWIRISDDSANARLDAAMRRGIDAFEKAERAIEREKGKRAASGA